MNTPTKLADLLELAQLAAAYLNCQPGISMLKQHSVHVIKIQVGNEQPELRYTDSGLTATMHRKLNKKDEYDSAALL